MLTASQTEKLIKAIQHRVPETIAIYIFGSAAAGTMTPDSDVDVAILRIQGSALDAEVAFQLKTDLAAILKKDIDLVDMLQADDVTKAQVITTGEVVMCSDPVKCSAFETTALAMYADLNEDRREILEDIKARGSIYGG
jgi:predicted nucleotidyltransferase